MLYYKCKLLHECPLKIFIQKQIPYLRKIDGGWARGHF